MELQQKGGLYHPSCSIYQVIHLADRALELKLISTGGQAPADRHFLHNIYIEVYKASSADRIIFSALREHDVSLLDQHVPKLVKLLLLNYISAQMGYLTKLLVEDEKGAAANQRNQQTRLTIFEGL